MNDAAQKPGRTGFLQRLNALIRSATGRYLNLWSLLTLLSVAAILALCILLWDIASIRPVLATVGAGLAAFLGPIPGIISPEIRTKWLVTIGVSALIAAGTWFATQDLANRLQARTDEVNELHARLASQGGGFENLLETATPEALDAIFLEAADLMRARHKAKRPDEVLDIALPLWRLRPDNGTALAFAGYGYRALGKLDDAKKYFENYIANVPAEAAALAGAQKACNERADGYCAERTGWIYHVRAAMAVREAAQASGEQKLKLLQEAFEREASNVVLVKWSRPDKADQGFNAEDEEPMSSCAVLVAIASELKALGKEARPVTDLREGRLKCG